MFSVPEPVELWQNAVTENGSVNLLKSYYREPVKYGLQFQKLVMRTLYESQLNIPADVVVIAERSIASGFNIFTRLMQRKGHLTPPETEILKNELRNYTLISSRQPDLLVYFYSKPTTACFRTKARARSEESEISLEYFYDIDAAYYNWLFRSGEVSTPILLVNTDTSVAESFETFDFLQQLLEKSIQVRKLWYAANGNS